MAAMHEDAASVLEQFVQDVANLPAEVVHLLEEIEAKDKICHESRTTISQRDTSIQKFGKTNGFSQPNPKEEAYSKLILSSFDTMQALQDEKVALGDKARVLLDRQIKRLDIQIKALESAGVIPPDPLLPSLLNHSSGNRVPPLSTPTTGTSTPLNPTTGNAQIPSNPISNAAVRILTQQASQPSPRHHSPAVAGTAAPAGTAGNAAHSARNARESSIEIKRRRLANQPATSSSLRQSSLGPSSTPKASTPGASGRAGSAGPRSSSVKPSRSGLGPKARGNSSLNPASANRKGGNRRKGYRKGIHGLKPSPSDGDDSALSEVGDSENERGSQAHRGGMGADGTHDTEMVGVEEDDDDGGDGDDRKYCTCRNVSYGNMVACDNDDCEFEWFHWGCVGMTREPVGKWYCEACKVKLGLK